MTQASSVTPFNQASLEGQPFNIDAEQALLGILLLNNESIEHVADFLKPEHFADQAHGRIYNSIIKTFERGQIADPITLKDYFINDDSLKNVGGPQYLIDLADSVISVMSAADYGRLIYDMFLRRQLINIGHTMITDVRTVNVDTSAQYHLENTEKKLFDLATSGQVSGNAINFSDALSQSLISAENAFKREGKIVGVPSGFTDLDQKLGGLHPSDLIILAGRPSMGKTALATNIAFNAAMSMLENNSHHGTSIAFFSLEMSSEQLATRILSAEAKISSDKIRRGEIRSDDFPTLLEVSRRIGSLGLFIDDTPAITVTALRNRARRLKRQHNIGLIVIDYLQLLESTSRRSGGGENRVQEISEISRSLKAIAKELNVPVLALSQLSRAVEQRDDKRPQLSDLRESGSIEQDADVVIFVYREEYYEARKEPPQGTEKYIEWQEKMSKVYNRAEVIIAKQRHGPIGTVKLFFDGRFTKFGNLTETETIY